MRTIAIVIIVAILIGAGYWIYRIVDDRQNKEPETVQSIAAFNQSKNADATSSAASPRDVIVYTLTVENKSNRVAEGYEVKVDISDISQKATLIDAQGANYDSATNSLVWTPLDVPANGSFDKTFTVRVKDTISSEADPVIRANFGNDLAINLERSVATTVTPKPSTPAVSETPKPEPKPVVKPATVTAQKKAPVSGPSEMLAVILAGIATLGFAVKKLAN